LSRAVPQKQLIFIKIKLKKLIKIFNALSIIEIALMLNILLHIAFVIAKNSSQYFDLILVLIFFITPIAISWKIILLTAKSIKASETLLIIGHIFNVIKILTLLILIFGGLYFFIETNHYVAFNNEKGIHYYLFFLSSLLFIPVSLLTFISYFAISKNNKKDTNNIIHSIGE
jgi:hypothetical protein